MRTTFSYPLYLLVVQYYYCTASRQATFEAKFLKISPARTTIAGGSTINITCTLHNASTSEFNVTDFYFYNTSDGSFISDNVIFGDDAAWYTYHATHSNITRELNISCGIHDTQWDAHATITVNDSLPKITSCIVHNWRYMTCAWESGQPDQANTTSLFWRIMDLPEDFAPCNAGYICNITDYEHRHEYEFEFRNPDNQAITSNIVDARNIKVKPGVVTDVTVEAYNSSSMLLAWASPSKPNLLHYRVQIVGEHYEKVITLNSRGGLLRSELTDLRPFTIYTVNISCIPILHSLKQGHWSDSVYSTFRTKSTVPSAHPATLNGAWTRIGSSQNVMLYWQPVPLNAQHGRFVQYEIYYNCIHNFTAIPCNSDALSHTYTLGGQTYMYNQPVNGNSAVLDLTQAADVHVVVVLKNDAGINDGLNVTELIIPKMQPDTEYIQVFAVVQLNVSYARVHWQFSDNITDDAVTVVWCKGSYNSMLCTDPLESVTVPITNSTLDVNVDLVSSYLFGITTVSTSNNISKYGIQWANCQHEKYQELYAVADLRISAHNNKAIIEWHNGLCSGAYIQYYVVQYSVVGEDEIYNDTLSRLSVKHEVILELEKKYEIWITSVGLNDVRKHTEKLKFSLHSSSSDRSSLWLLVIIPIITSVLLVVCIYKQNSCKLKELWSVKVPYVLPAVPLQSHEADIGIDSSDYFSASTAPAIDIYRSNTEDSGVHTYRSTDDDSNMNSTENKIVISPRIEPCLTPFDAGYIEPPII